MRQTTVKPARLHPAVWVSLLIVAVFAAAIYPQALSAGEPIIPVDAVSVLTGGSNSGESDAVPILLSDVEFEAYLILTGRTGPAGISEKPTEDDWQHAKERAVIIRLLADQARRLHETASEEDKITLRSEIVGNFGDATAMNRLLAEIGTNRDAVDRWVENAALALGQLRFLKDQSTMPGAASDRTVRAADGGDPVSSEDTRRRYQQIIGKNTGNEELRNRIVEIVSNNHIRVLR